jgi:hypothetical protein
MLTATENDIAVMQWRANVYHLKGSWLYQML